MHKVRLACGADVSTIARFNQAMAWETENLELPLATLEAGTLGVLEDHARGRYFVVDGEHGLAEGFDVGRIAAHHGQGQA